MKNKIKFLLRKFSLQIIRLGNTEVMLESFITKYKKNDNNFFFVQVGANNGVRYDPIYKIVNELKIKGLVIEPIKEYYDELVNNYAKNSYVIPVNMAIYSEDKGLTMYRVKKYNNLPDWANGIASLDPKHYERTIVTSNDIIEENVEGITFDTLIQKYNIDKIDFLQIDTEGYDYNILKMFPFDRFMPSLIHFEHSLATENMSYDQYDEIHSMLIRLGYKTIMNTNDTICYLD